jgi:hypothetical protein
MPATLPARRGMRAAWYRGRPSPDITGEPAPASGLDAEPAVDGADPGEASERSPGRQPGDLAEPVGPVRPAFGHPTF